MRKKLKLILRRKSTLIICSILLLLFIFMSSGYAVLKTKFDIKGQTYIKEEEKWQPRLSFIEISQLEDVFFYQIIIENNSNQNCYAWQLRIHDTGVISFPFGIDAEKQQDNWIINNKPWDGRIEAGGRLIVNITFRISLDENETMTTKEYAEYFVKNHIKISADTEERPGKQGNIITSGKATLTLDDREEEIKDYIFEENKLYNSENSNEKQYILTVYNKTGKIYSDIRANMYIGEAMLLDVSPSEVICDNIDNITFETPFEVQLGDEEGVSVYITLKLEDTKFAPDIIVAALLE